MTKLLSVLLLTCFVGNAREISNCEYVENLLFLESDIMPIFTALNIIVFIHDNSDL